MMMLNEGTFEDPSECEFHQESNAINNRGQVHHWRSRRGAVGEYNPSHSTHILDLHAFLRRNGSNPRQYTLEKTVFCSTIFALIWRKHIRNIKKVKHFTPLTNTNTYLK